MGVVGTGRCLFPLGLERHTQPFGCAGKGKTARCRLLSGSIYITWGFSVPLPPPAAGGQCSQATPTVGTATGRPGCSPQGDRPSKGLVARRAEAHGSFGGWVLGPNSVITGVALGEPSEQEDDNTPQRWG